MPFSEDSDGSFIVYLVIAAQVGSLRRVSDG